MKWTDALTARSGEHDDLVLAVALAVWRCQSRRPLEHIRFRRNILH